MTPKKIVQPSLEKPVSLHLREYRCGCNRLLFKGALTPGCRVEVRCGRCGSLRVFEMENCS